MKILIKRRAFGLILTWAQRVLFACAIVMLGYSGFVLVDTLMFQNREKRTLDRLLDDQLHIKTLKLHIGAPASGALPPAIGPDGLIGRVEVSRLGLSEVVLEGTSNAVLRRAAGHIPGTGLPGQPGNVGLAGHRDTFFLPLRNIQIDDIITLTTLGGEYRYRVMSTKVVGPYDVAVLNPDGNEILTLVTCYPFYFVGPAPKRFIVRAERVT